MKVKILVPWMGRLPEWTPKFLERVSHSAPTFEWDVFQVNWENLRGRIEVTQLVQTPDTIAPRKLCDFRPFFGQLYEDRLRGYDWWGWSDLDVVLGDLPGIITQDHLEAFELISDHEKIVNGPLTLIRNCYYMNSEILTGAPRSVIESPEHVAFDEIGYTKIVRGSSAQTCYLNAHVHDKQEPDPILRDGKLYSSVDGREILTYHVTSKRWPL